MTIRLLKDLINTQKYRMKNNSLELQLDDIKKSYEELKVAKLDELLAYKEKFLTNKKQLKRLRSKIKEMKEK